ncbi:MAG TPA: hypothetical protein VHB49_19520, partial [Bradyrhizobium sp.]|nr:hypothetical protein [Bradyrhizobium sp.]
DQALGMTPTERAADAQKLERRRQGFVRLQTSFSFIAILPSDAISLAERACSSATEEPVR